mgnify:CR=1 FL=1
MERQNIRKLMRSRRNELSENEQLEAAKKIKVNIFQHLKIVYPAYQTNHHVIQ